ncbi:hypothetical protein UFOVP458_6 [uncultured Caudovirales phage]|uniref:Uncharacterized protein n=1 Tax=uncultured Caudovirales phage TaxID=2100421 RepID=A0A6J5MB82_9CAUD|nr:hypothetical protein UFOVP458_6 [uncultured Caudovirales phage]
MKNFLINLNQRPIAVYPIYIKLTGSVNAGLLLSQIMYWYGAMKGKTFYKSDSEIMEETMLSVNELRHAKLRLKQMSFIKISLHGIPAKTHYTIDDKLLISEINECSLVESTKLNKSKPRNYNSDFNETNTENTTENTTKNTSDISSKNSIEFCQNEKEIYFEDLEEFPIFPSVEIKSVSVKKNEKQKLNPFQVVSDVEKERKENFASKEKKEAPERKPNPNYEAFTIFCQTFEQLSGANYPTDQNGHYIMMPKDAGNMVYLMRFIDKIDRNGNSHEALKIFMQAAWSLNDKWLKANFTIANLYSQASKIFTAYQTSSPAAKDKAYNDRLAELLAERMAKFED